MRRAAAGNERAVGHPVGGAGAGAGGGAAHALPPVRLAPAIQHRAPRHQPADAVPPVGASASRGQAAGDRPLGPRQQLCHASCIPSHVFIQIQVTAPPAILQELSCSANDGMNASGTLNLCDFSSCDGVVRQVAGGADAAGRAGLRRPCVWLLHGGGLARGHALLRLRRDLRLPAAGVRFQHPALLSLRRVDARTVNALILPPKLYRLQADCPVARMLMF